MQVSGAENHIDEIYEGIQRMLKMESHLVVKGLGNPVQLISCLAS